MEFDLNKRHCFYFKELANIPRGSRNEKAVSDYVVAFAKQHNLTVKQDHVYNVIIEKPGTHGLENASPVILQAHLDMVNEKNKDSNHNFETDPLDLYVEDGWLKARGTTLGCDDGYGCSYMLAILESETIKHPPLQCIFTTMEEIGLLGACELKKEDIHADRMISLDGGGENTTTVSSAGGANVFVRKEVSFEENTNPTYMLSIRGLLGGHSGGLIHTEKGNSNLLAARLLKEAIYHNYQIQLVSFQGGLKDNAIPREADVLFTSSTPLSDLEESFKNTEADIKKELQDSDPGFYCTFTQVDASSTHMSLQDTSDVLDYIYLVPNGMLHKSMVIEGLTEASSNLGVITTENNIVLFDHLIRSAKDTMTKHTLNQIRTIASRLNMQVEAHETIKGWAYDPQSQMRQIFRKVLEKRGETLVERATHGGLETGILKGLNPNLDIITHGPRAEGAHTPDEKMNLESFDKSFEILCEILGECN